MLELREYQAIGLEKLSEYLSLASHRGAREAFALATDGRHYQSVKRLA